MKIAVICGAFNPVTKAHVNMGHIVRDKLLADKVIYTPSGNSFLSGWKNLSGIQAISGDLRLTLLNKAISSYSYLETEDIEIKEGTMKTYDLLEYLKEKHSADEVFFVCGSDKLSQLHIWYKADELLTKFRIFVIGRSGDDVQALIKADPFLSSHSENILFSEEMAGFSDMSSSQIRNAAEKGNLESVRNIIPDECANILYDYYKEKKMSFNAKEKTEELVCWLQKWFEINGKDCNAVIGISGGKDSSIAAAVCVKALGKDHVIGVLMPNGEQPDIDCARKLVNHLGIKAYEINVKEAFDGVLSAVSSSLPDGIQNQTRINLGPRIRMTTLYAVSQSVNGRVINTCNLSENWVGYSTRYGDDAGDVSLFGNLTVREVKEIGRYLGVPSDLVDKVPSDGLCGKTDEDNLGFTYDTLDTYIREGICHDPKTKELIDKKHRQNLFKLELMKTFPDEL